MLSERHADTVAVWAPAKVNLYLEVLAKRADGYHDIETLMVAVSLYDTLEFKEEASGEIRLRCGHPGLGTGPDNLVCRAATLLRQRTGCDRGARIRLTKRIPLAAGLAGGSTDAAATLAGLNRLWRLGLTRADLAALGAELGSDVAFFFSTPAAWCTGRGEQVTPCPLGKSLLFVLVCPPVGLSTADVYRGVTVPAQPLSGDDIRRAARAGDREAIGRCLHNRLQPVAEGLCPMVATLRSRLEGLGPAGQLMSGSGTSLFALCRDRGEAVHLARALRHGLEEEVRPHVFMVRSCF
ncbi:MAG TPA: 4-(cytidine 5'-diphospho)-2-C-methyl-D-erythritol kinase [Gemmataceae bacterium]|jgi:4-diphosphocytidyl-2-C-methyl-D-erythritol kinase|nr:4-(cytidine 5'-diphospho)-2-C-methyl-D-erythritol kinase [Gemmataceae bacterium]